MLNRLKLTIDRASVGHDRVERGQDGSKRTYERLVSSLLTLTLFAWSFLAPQHSVRARVGTSTRLLIQESGSRQMALALENAVEQCETRQSTPQDCIQQLNELAVELRAKGSRIREERFVASLHRRSKLRLFEAYFMMGEAQKALKVLEELVLVEPLSPEETQSLEIEVAQAARDFQVEVQQRPRSRISIQCVDPCTVYLNDAIVPSTGDYRFGVYRLVVRGNDPGSREISRSVELDEWMRNFELDYRARLHHPEPKVNLDEPIEMRRWWVPGVTGIALSGVGVVGIVLGDHRKGSEEAESKWTPGQTARMDQYVGQWGERRQKAEQVKSDDQAGSTESDKGGGLKGHDLAIFGGWILVIAGAISVAVSIHRGFTHLGYHLERKRLKRRKPRSWEQKLNLRLMHD